MTINILKDIDVSILHCINICEFYVKISPFGYLTDEQSNIFHWMPHFFFHEPDYWGLIYKNNIGFGVAMLGDGEFGDVVLGGSGFGDAVLGDGVCGDAVLGDGDLVMMC